jgi:hypothetical protein
MQARQLGSAVDLEVLRMRRPAVTRRMRPLWRELMPGAAGPHCHRSDRRLALERGDAADPPACECDAIPARVAFAVMLLLVDRSIRPELELGL